MRINVKKNLKFKIENRKIRNIQIKKQTKQNRWEWRTKTRNHFRKHQKWIKMFFLFIYHRTHVPRLPNEIRVPVWYLCSNEAALLRWHPVCCIKLYYIILYYIVLYCSVLYSVLIINGSPDINCHNKSRHCTIYTDNIKKKN